MADGVTFRNVTLWHDPSSLFEHKIWAFIFAIIKFIMIKCTSSSFSPCMSITIKKWPYRRVSLNIFYIGQRLVVNFMHIDLWKWANFVKLHIWQYVVPNTRPIPIIYNKLDLMTVFPFGIDHQALSVSRDWNPAIKL